MPRRKDSVHQKQVNAWVKYLKKEFPLDRRCEVWVLPKGAVKLECGTVVRGVHYVTASEKTHMIELEHANDFHPVFDTLIWEWARARVWPYRGVGSVLALEVGRITRACLYQTP